MKQAEQVDILLIWVNAERQLEQGFVDALADHAGFTRPEIVDRDAHQAEISAAFPAEPDILEAIIEGLLALPDYDIEIQGAEKERQPTVVFSAIPLHGRPKPIRSRDVRRHVDDPLQPTRWRTHTSSERVLSTSEMAQESGPSPGIVTPPAQGRQPIVDPSSAGERDRPVWRSRRYQPAQPRLVPLIKKIARIIFLEDQAPTNTEPTTKPDSKATPEE